ncbi:MAG: AMP-binding protein, partial [Gemmatimonadetes bacterium]|nr:AMP-binding protein [Gemmatimonadota bacterium]
MNVARQNPGPPRRTSGPPAATGPAGAGEPLDPYDRTTLNAVFHGAVDRFAEAPALRWRKGSGWSELSYGDAADRVARIAGWLVDRGVRPGDRLGILSENRPEWTLFDYAALALGAVTVPVYPTLPPDQVAYILEDAGARGIVVSSAEQLAKLRVAGDGPWTPEWIVLLDEGETPDGSVFPWERLVGHEPLPDLRQRASRVRPDDLATLVYSSGTTGPPKGVMLSHGNLAYMVAATAQHGSVAVAAGDVCLSILPLSHVFERAAA